MWLVASPRQEKREKNDAAVEGERCQKAPARFGGARIGSEQAPVGLRRARHRGAGRRHLVRLELLRHRFGSSFSSSVIMPSDSTPARRAAAMICTTSPYGSERSAC